MRKLQILKGCRNGDSTSQKELYDRYCHELYGICLRYASGTEEAKSLLRDTFLEIYKYLYKEKPDAPLDEWMRSAAVYVSIQHLLMESPLFPYLEIRELADDYYIEKEPPAKDELILALQQLPVGYRTVFNLHAIEKMNHRDIEYEMGISEFASRLNFSRAKAALYQFLEQQRN